MITEDASSILSDASAMVTPFARTRGAPPEALATTSVPDDGPLWDDACERMLAWRSGPETFDPEDEPTADILDTAIDFTVDQRISGGPAPSIIIPSGGGRVAFEWHSRGATVVIEFIARGRACYTRLAGGKVIETAQLTRNPRSRNLERAG